MTKILRPHGLKCIKSSIFRMRQDQYGYIDFLSLYVDSHRYIDAYAATYSYKNIRTCTICQNPFCISENIIYINQNSENYP